MAQYRYEILHSLGKGGGGEVYLAADKAMSGRRVALKRIRAAVDDSVRAAMAQEFTVMASLSVPGVARVYDYGAIEDVTEGQNQAPFFTRDYVEGSSLDEACRTQSRVERIELFVRLCAVVEPLHRAGVVHGDLKPGNVIVDAASEVHVIDFGMACLARPAFPSGTPAGGTLPYMAPEMLRGGAATVAGDVYALGVLLWWLLTDSLPFSKLGARSAEAKLAGLRPDIPEQASSEASAALHVAQNALSAEPLERTPTVGEMAAALSPLVPKQPERGSVFVQPRPRGRDPIVSEIELELIASCGEGRSLLAVQGEHGAGKTLLLTELKWRLQLRGALVIEVMDPGNGGTGVVSSVHCQVFAQTLSDEAPLSDDLGEQIDQIARLVRARTAYQPVVFMIDDLDEVEPATAKFIRSLLHHELMDCVPAVCATTGAEPDFVATFGVHHVVPVPPLSPDDVKLLAKDVLGSVDSSVVDALSTRTGRVAGRVVEALAELCTIAGPTAGDVAELSVGRAGEGIARGLLQRTATKDLPGLWLLAISQSASEAAFNIALGGQGASPLSRLKRAGLVRVAAGSVRLAGDALGAVLRDQLGERMQETAVGLLGRLPKELLTTIEESRLAVAAGDEARCLKTVESAAATLTADGALRRAVELLAGACAHVKRARGGALHLQYARALILTGDNDTAAAVAGPLSRDDAQSPELRVEAALMAARSLTGLAKFDEAVQALSMAGLVLESEDCARVQCELSRVRLRMGDYDNAALAAEAGLVAIKDCIPAHRVCIELLCCKGAVAGYRGDGAIAKELYEDALKLCRTLGSPADEAKVLSYLAIGEFRLGNLVVARRLITQALEVARRGGDIGFMANALLNLGAIIFYLGQAQGSAEHYDSAIRLARRAGSYTTQLQARTNLAHVHVYLGLYEQAREELTGLREDAERVEHRYVIAQLSAVRGDLQARTANVDEALVAYDEAIGRFKQLGQPREMAEHHLDAAEALIDRGGAADGSAAASRLAMARKLLAEQSADDLELRCDLLVGRVRFANGEAVDVLPELERIVAACDGPRMRDLRWQALAVVARVHVELGAVFVGAGFYGQAVETLEETAVHLSGEYSQAYWHDSRRRAVRRAAKMLMESNRVGASLEADVNDGRRLLYRLLEIMKRLATERDVERLLERIVDSAVELSSAERGFVLLRGDEDGVTPRVARGPEGHDDTNVEFSRSIAESVLIDGDSIVTMDAAHDGRLREYASVHQLTLRSVACLPIRDQSGVVGALYLEHRRRRDCFGHEVVELLHAFADQAAIALGNARLSAEIVGRQVQLERANAELADAKLHLENVLSAQTHQLHEVQDQLLRVSKQPAMGQRYGMIGVSAPMQAVFEMVERLKDASIPVVIRGESGTGKELLARALHFGGVRRSGPFIAVNCGALPGNLLESELFGHAKGAFSGAERDRDGLIAQADGGTLFLDEVSDMPAQMQVDLLRVLQEGRVRRLGATEERAVTVRYVAATQKDLRALVESGQFREDLYYRLNVVELKVPPLRERPSDIPELCRHIIGRFAEKEGVPHRRLSTEALRRLVSAPLSGNVRELEHRLQQGMLLGQSKFLSPKDLGFVDVEIGGFELQEGDNASSPPPFMESPVTDSPSLVPSSPGAPESLPEHRQQERENILAALEACSWNRAKAAKQLGMARRTFYRRLREYEILQEGG